MRSLICVFFLIAAHSANSQDFRWEVGAQLVRLDLDSIGESAGGAGGRVSYFVNRLLTLEAEANRYFEDPSGNFGHTQFLAGVRSGYRIGPFGAFVKARPGFVQLGGGAAARNPGRENHFAVDIGGAITIGQRRTGMRIDAGDTLIFWGSQPFATALPRPVSRHNRQLSVRFVIRF